MGLGGAARAAAAAAVTVAVPLLAAAKRGGGGSNTSTSSEAVTARAPGERRGVPGREGRFFKQTWSQCFKFPLRREGHRVSSGKYISQNECTY